MEKVTVAGITIPLRAWSRNEMKGLPVIYSYSYRFYDFSFKGIQMILLEPGKEHSTPTTCKKTAARIEEQFGRLAVFYFDNLLYLPIRNLQYLQYLRGKRCFPPHADGVSGEKEKSIGHAFGLRSVSAHVPPPGRTY